MTLVTTFDPSASVSGQFDTKLPTGGQFLLSNQSNINLLLTFGDGKTAYVPAWQIPRPFTIPTKSSIVLWKQQSSLGGTSPISQVAIDAFQPGEVISGTYPVSIQHTAYVPNQVSTILGGATSVQNDNNAQVVFVEATLLGSPSSNVSIDNSGNMYLAQTFGGVTSKIFQILANQPTLMIIGLNGTVAQFISDIQAVGKVQASGDVTTSGNFKNNNGTVLGMQRQVTPYLFANNVTLNNGSVTTYQITGNGNPAIPSNATFALISSYWTGAVVGAELSMGPQGYSYANASGGVLFGVAEILAGGGGTGFQSSNGVVPINTTNGQIDVKAPNGQINSFNASVYGWIA